MKCMDKHEFEQQNVFGTGAANTAYAKFFIGQSFLNPLTDPKTGLFLANVTFEPGCRNNWHIHHAAKGGGQLLVCTAGEGWYQEEGKPAVSLTPAPRSPSRPTSSTGTVPRPTAGSATLLWKFPAKIAATNGASPLPTKSTPN